MKLYTEMVIREPNLIAIFHFKSLWGVESVEEVIRNSSRNEGI